MTKKWVGDWEEWGFVVFRGPTRLDVGGCNSIVGGREQGRRYWSPMGYLLVWCPLTNGWFKRSPEAEGDYLPILHL